MVMTLAALLLMALIRRLGLAIVEIEQSRVSHGAVLKQVPAWLLARCHEVTVIDCHALADINTGNSRGHMRRRQCSCDAAWLEGPL
jgi:hypothetical protein